MTQKIRLVCTGDAKCRHLFGRKGAKGKVVRLPESVRTSCLKSRLNLTSIPSFPQCGKNAFAHIKAARPSANRSIPDSIAAKIDARIGQPDIQELDIDTDFSSTDEV